MSTPAVRKKPARSVKPETIEELNEQIEIDEKLMRPPEWREAWEKDWRDNNLNVWERLETACERSEKCHVYLYRLEPRVFNAVGEGSNIGKYYFPPALALETLKTEHGGGKYKIHLKYGRWTLGEWIVALDGPPVFKAGQTDKTGKELVAKDGAPPAKNEIAEMVRAVGEILKSQGSTDQTAMQSSVRILENAMTTGLKMQAEAAGSPTGNKVGDALLPTLLERALTPPATVDQFALFTKFAELLKNLQPAPAPVAPNPEPGGIFDTIEKQFSIVKDLAGVDSIRDLLGKAGGGAKVDVWANIGAQFVTVLPALINQFGQMSELNFRRQIFLASLQGKDPAEVAALVAGAMPTARGPVTPGAPASQPTASAVVTEMPPGAIPIQAELLNHIVFDIRKYFINGVSGDECARHLMLNVLPAETQEALKPLLANEAELSAMVQKIPNLAEFANGPGTKAAWDDFVFDFAAQMSGREPDDEEDADDLPLASPANGIEQKSTPRRKKKTETEVKEPVQ